MLVSDLAYSSAYADSRYYFAGCRGNGRCYTPDASLVLYIVDCKASLVGFITLAGFHALNLSMFELARDYRDRGMIAYAGLQQREFDRETDAGYRAVKHQAFVGTAYFDTLSQTIMSGMSSTTALSGLTEEEQFAAHARANSETRLRRWAKYGGLYHGTAPRCYRAASPP